MDVTGSELKQIIGENVRVRRQELGQTQMDLAQTCGMPQSWISKLERGRVGFTDDSLARIADALKIKPHILLDPGAFSLIPA